MNNLGKVGLLAVVMRNHTRSDMPFKSLGGSIPKHNTGTDLNALALVSNAFHADVVGGLLAGVYAIWAG